MPIRAVTFDLDHTLWDLEDVLPRAEQLAYDFLARGYPRAAERYSVERLRELRMEIYRQREDLRHNVTELRKQVYRQVASDCGYDESLVEGAFAVFLQARHDVILYDDVLPLLDALRGHYVLGVITNGNAEIERVGLADYFDVVVSAGEVGAAKPDRVVFEAACHRAGVPAAETAHVGDEPHSDVIGAAGYGMRAVWLNRLGSPWPEELARCDYVEMSDLTGFADWLQRQ